MKKTILLAAAIICGIGTHAQDMCSRIVGLYFFNDTATNHLGADSFISSSASYPVSYTSGIGDRAIITTQHATRTATIPGLPVDSAARTITMWVQNTSNFLNSPGIFRYGNSATGETFGAYFSEISSSSAHFTFQGYGTGYDYTTGVTISNYRWYHIAIVYTGVEIKFYINGIMRGGDTIALNTTTTDNKFILNSLGGMIDDLRIYSRALSDNDVEALYNNYDYRCTPPEAPTALAVTENTDPLYVSLTWTDNTPNEKGYKVERSSDGFNFSEIKDLTADATSVNDSTVSHGSTYHYRVYAYDSAGSPSAYTNIAEITVSTPVGIAANNASAWSTHPNPANTALYITTREKASLSVISMLGKTVARYEVNAGSNYIDISHLIPGIYILQDHAGHTIRFIKE